VKIIGKITSYKIESMPKTKLDSYSLHLSVCIVLVSSSAAAAIDMATVAAGAPRRGRREFTQHQTPAEKRGQYLLAFFRVAVHRDNTTTTTTCLHGSIGELLFHAAAIGL
jgi:hypothetical protein